MNAFAALFGPPVIASLLWLTLFPRRRSLKGFLGVYTMLFCLIYFLEAFADCFLSSERRDIFYKLRTYNDYALRYTIIAGTLAVLLPVLCSLLKEVVPPFAARCAARLDARIPSPAHSGIILALYALVLFGMNLVRIFDNNIWGDEAFSIYMSTLPVSEIVRITAGDMHPPLYYFFVAASYRTLGARPWAYHLVSLVPYAVTLIFLVTVIRKRFGAWVSLLMITFSSILSAALTYNVEIRMYSWAALFVLLAYYGFCRIISEGSAAAYGVFIASSLAAAYTHYYALLSVAFFYLGLLVLSIRKRIRFRTLALTYLLTVVGYLPWLRILFKSFVSASENFWLTTIISFTDCFRHFFWNKSTWYTVLMLFSAFLAIFLALKQELGAGSAYPSCHLSDPGIRILWGLLAVVGTICVGEGVSYAVRPFLLDRYLYPVTPVFWLVFCISLSILPYKKLFCAAIFTLTCAVCIPQYCTRVSQERQQDRLIAKTQASMEEMIPPGDVILNNQPNLNWTSLSYYLPDRPHWYADSPVQDFDLSLQNWIAWKFDLTQEECEALQAAGYQVEETLHAGKLAEYPIHLYKVTAR